MRGNMCVCYTSAVEHVQFSSVSLDLAGFISDVITCIACVLYTAALEQHLATILQLLQLERCIHLGLHQSEALQHYTCRQNVGHLSTI